MSETEETSPLPELLTLANLGKSISVEVHKLWEPDGYGEHYAGYLESFYDSEDGFIIVIRGFPYKLTFRKDTHKVIVKLGEP